MLIWNPNVRQSQAAGEAQLKCLEAEREDKRTKEGKERAMQGEVLIAGEKSRRASVINTRSRKTKLQKLTANQTLS